MAPVRTGRLANVIHADLHLLESLYLVEAGKNPGRRCRRCGEPIDLNDAFGLSESVCRSCCGRRRETVAGADDRGRPPQRARQPIRRVSTLVRALASR